jgi:purine-binding chemotaxis protein CheW
MLTQEQYCTFELGDLLLGIEVSRVQEVLRGLPVTPVPLAPAEVTGLMNLRGQIVLVIDLRRRLDMEARKADAAVTNVLVQTRTSRRPTRSRGRRRRSRGSHATWSAAPTSCRSG